MTLFVLILIYSPLPLTTGSPLKFLQVLLFVSSLLRGYLHLRSIIGICGDNRLFSNWLLTFVRLRKIEKTKGKDKDFSYFIVRWGVS